MNILFLNHKIKKCGVYQYGVRLYNILKKSKNINYIFKEIESYEEYFYLINNFNYDAILYNYHPMIMSWLNENNIQRKNKNIGLQHDLTENDIFDITLRLDLTLKEKENRYNIQRPIYENINQLLENYEYSSSKIKEFIEYSEENIPIFGSFGFCFNRKRFDKIVELINNKYDKAIIKFIMTSADTCGPNLDVFEKCINSNIKPNIKLMFYTDFTETLDILKFLKSNTMNIFLHETHESAGLASGIDYALSVRKPIGVSNTSWFRHIYSKEIDVYETDLEEIIKKGSDYCDQFLQLYSHNNLIDTVDNIILNK